VPYDVARKTFLDLLGGGSRGVRPELGDYDPERLVELRRMLEEPPSDLAQDWSVPGWQTFAVDCRVEGER
jgi:hypothetical protein